MAKINIFLKDDNMWGDISAKIGICIQNKQLFTFVFLRYKKISPTEMIIGKYLHYLKGYEYTEWCSEDGR